MSEHPILFSGPMVRAILEGKKTQTRRVIKFPTHTYAPDFSWVASVNPDGKNGWVAWGPKPTTDEFSKRAYPNGGGFLCPYGQSGDSLWVRETWGGVFEDEDGLALQWRSVPMEYRTKENLCGEIFYRADPNYGDDPEYNGCWVPSIFMPRWASRITLTVVSVRVERVQDISEEDAKAEGVEPNCSGEWQTCPRCFNEGAHVCLAEGEYIHYLRGMDELPAFSATESFESLWQSINSKRPGCSWQDNPYVWVVEFSPAAQP